MKPELGGIAFFDQDLVNVHSKVDMANFIDTLLRPLGFQLPSLRDMPWLLEDGIDDEVEDRLWTVALLEAVKSTGATEIETYHDDASRRHVLKWR